MKKFVIAVLLVAAAVIYIVFTDKSARDAEIITLTTPGVPDEATSTMPPVTTPSVQFSRELSFGSTGPDVLALQQLLINKGYLGIKTPTGYFGFLTQAALANFQAANGLAPFNGMFNAETMAFVNNGTATTTTVATTGMYKDGTYTGDEEGLIFGKLQAVAVISGGKITDVEIPIYPDEPGHTSQVSAMAVPALKAEAITAQSAKVNIVSGATQDSEAFQQSLASALAQAQN